MVVMSSSPMSSSYIHNVNLQLSSGLSSAQKDILAGTCAGIANILVCHPLDTIRVRMQTTDASRFHSISDLIRKTYHHEGVKGFYKGVTPPIFAQGIQKATMFYTFGISKRFIESYNIDVTHSTSNTNNSSLTPLEVLLCGSLAGGATAIIASPVELIRNNLQVQYSKHVRNARFHGPIHAVVSILKTDGILGLWRGVTPMILRDVPGVGMWYFGFENARRIFTTLLIPESSSSTQPPTWLVAMSGACAGLCYWTFAFPQDAIKSVMQTQIYHQVAANLNTTSTSSTISHAFLSTDGFLTTGRKLIATGGIRRLYRGYTSSLIRGILGASTTFSVFHVVMQYINSH